MRAVLLASVALWPGLALAEDFTVPLPVVSAEVFPSGALTVRESELELPAGAHRIMALLPPGAGGAIRPEVTGAALAAVSLGENTGFDPVLFDIPAVAAARAALEAEEVALRTAEEAAERVASELQALEVQDAFLRSVTGGGTLATAEELVAVTAILREQLAEIAGARRALEADLREADAALSEARASYDRAAMALGALRPGGPGWQLMTLDVVVAEAGPVTVRLPGFDGSARWSIGYEARLFEESATMALGRTVTVTQRGGLPWVDATVKLSTATPTGALAATEVGRSIARIFEPGRVAPLSLSRNEVAVMEEPMMAAEMAPALDDSRLVAGVDAEGAVVRYDLPTPVTVLPGATGVQVALGTLSFDVDPYLLAAPRFDETAFIMADFTNDSGEPIPSGEALVYRGDTLINSGFLPEIAAGAEETLGFGPEQAIALEVTFLDQQSGDRGIIRGQRTREDAIRLEARNLGDAEKVVRLRYAVPTSQQEDLQILVEMTPEPDARDVDDLIGVMEWELTLGAGAVQEIDLAFDLRWPEGQELSWRP